RSYARYWLETFRLPKMAPADLLARIDATGAEHLAAALDRGRGAVVALPHQGNWDVAGVWLVAQHGPFTTVAERLEPASLYDRFVAYRESLGIEVLPLTGGAQPPADVLRQRLNQNRAVCLVADRELSRSGIEVQFFGEPARMPGGPALLAATTGAALLPVGLWFTAGGWGHRIHPAVALPQGSLRQRVTAGTQAVADRFAEEIAAHPADWHMLQRLWLADLPAREPARVNAR
ncbi:MAG: phosphatidylinositol mannoside acyltransferase, partial [Actinomycetota bacterium]|nr:phosphatidylinositol mannoside acyltransferase [Actinomycetota bacterium]